MAPGCFSSDREISFSLGLWNLLQQPQQKRDPVAKHDAIVNNQNQKVEEGAKAMTKKLEEASHDRWMNRLIVKKKISKMIE